MGAPHRSSHDRPRLVANPRLLLGSLAIAGVYFALFGMYFDLTQYFKLVRGCSPVVAALYALPAGLAHLATANLGRQGSGSPCPRRLGRS
jgi:hypothetical protein